MSSFARVSHPRTPLRRLIFRAGVLLAGFLPPPLSAQTPSRGTVTGTVSNQATGNLESVELIKAPQPDQDANAVAGFVNLVSRLLLDVKLQYSFTRRYDVFLDINNLIDEAPRTNVTLNGLKFFKTNQGVGFTAGVRGKF